MEHIEDDLGKYGILHLRFLHEHKQEVYTELLFSGELAEHCTKIGKVVFEWSERIRISIQAQMVADEIVMTELVYR